MEHHLAFRDYLRTHSEAVKSYGDLKEKLSHKHPHDIESYIKGKEQLAKEIERKALEWCRNLER